MKYNRELENIFKRCINPFVFVRVSIFVLRKIILWPRRWLKPVSFYPIRVKKIYRKFQKDLSISSKLENRVYVEKSKTGNGKLRLCTGHSKYINEPVWDTKFDDQEESFSLHRWNWLLTSLTENPNESTEEWGFGLIRSWINDMMTPIEGLPWTPYTTGERISNACLFAALVNQNKINLLLENVLPDNIKNALHAMAFYLAANLEFKGKNRTGNHVINNARALFFASVFLDLECLLDLSKSILHENLPGLVTEDGFLREGSSHYQFLFTRWLLEMLWLSEISQNNIITDLLKPVTKRLVKQCWFFLMRDSSSGRWNMPLIGDISPDFTPDWLIGLPWSNLAMSVYCPEVIPPLPPNQQGWNLLWDDKPNLLSVSKKN